MTDDILFAQEGHIGMITLNRPKALNALTLPMILALQTQLDDWLHDAQIHAVIIQGAGDRAFCAGGDVRAIYDYGHEHHREKMEFFGQEYALNQFIYDFKKPYIAFMDGITMGGGVGVSLHGSHSVASQRFLFAMPETGIGFYPDIGASFLLSRCPGLMGVYLGLTGARLGAVNARALGLVKHIIDKAQWPKVVASLMEADLSQNAHQGVDAILSSFSMPTSSLAMENLRQMVDHYFNYPDVEQILAA